MEKEILILTKSCKNGGYCVAGIDLETKKSVRLVSDDQGTQGALSKDDLRYIDGECQIFDKIKVTIIREEPLLHQSENLLVDTSKCLKKLESVGIKDVLNVLENCKDMFPYIFKDTCPYLSENQVSNVNHSLEIVRVKNLKLYIKTYNYDNKEKIKTKANFEYNGEQYNEISVTDSDYYNITDYNSNINEAILIVSLPNKPIGNDKYYYKFIAKIIRLDNLHNI